MMIGDCAIIITVAAGNERIAVIVGSANSISSSRVMYIYIVKVDKAVRTPPRL